MFYIKVRILFFNIINISIEVYYVDNCNFFIWQVVFLFYDIVDIFCMMNTWYVHVLVNCCM